MLKRILVSGLLGGIVLFLWTFLVNGVFRLTVRLEMNEVADERSVYALLKENVVAPGAYIVNPPFTPDGQFPAGEPVFGIRYSGIGHEAAGRLLVMHLAIAFIAPTLVAGLLSMTSARVLSRYARKVLFIALIGLLLAVFGDLPKYGIGGHPASAALLIAANHAVSWVLAGLVMAGTMRAPAAAAPAG